VARARRKEAATRGKGAGAGEETHACRHGNANGSWLETFALSWVPACVGERRGCGGDSPEGVRGPSAREGGRRGG